MNQLPAETIPEAIAWMERTLADLRRLAEKHNQRQKNNDAQKRRRGRHLKTIDLLCENLKVGLPPETALNATATATGIDPDQIRPLLPKAINQAKNTERQIRNRAIMKKVALGYTDKEIGLQFGLAEKSVARIVAGIRKDGI